jgi:23S rRNA (pseudouridine1915-N3)-methyltransferase
MRITIVAVGKLRAGPERELFEHYRKRLDISIKEVEERRTLAPAERRRREAELLRAACPKGATLVALDARGHMLSSEDLAGRLEAWRDGGTAELAFVIGGADGLDATLVKDAAFVLSLGPMTWPHLLVRGMLAEQLYRAQAILAGHPYPRG